MNKILVVDDDAAILDALKIILEDEGYKVIVCSTGEKAMDLVLQTMPALLLLDIWMSGKNGLEISEEMKQHEETK